jgi:hypothetical protein
VLEEISVQKEQAISSHFALFRDKPAILIDLSEIMNGQFLHLGSS